jgi:hypothetical protein
VIEGVRGGKLRVMVKRFRFLQGGFQGYVAGISNVTRMRREKEGPTVRPGLSLTLHVTIICCPIPTST